MNSKNALIGGLIAVVLVMAVGYAAFSTQLNINGTANVTSTWNVGFDTTKTSGTGVITSTPGLSGATAPAGTISFGSNQSATLTANFQQPGDKVVFTLTVKNTGTLKAKLGTPTIAMTGGTISGLTATKGNLKFTVSNPVSTSVAPTTGTTTFTVTAEFINNTISTYTAKESATVTIGLNATQDTTA